MVDRIVPATTDADRAELAERIGLEDQAAVLTEPFSQWGTEDRFAGPWDIAQLKETPTADWGEKQGLLQAVHYAGEPFAGTPTRVFAWYARPAEGDGPFPAMVLVHGGGGTAFGFDADALALWPLRQFLLHAGGTNESAFAAAALGDRPHEVGLHRAGGFIDVMAVEAKAAFKAQ